MRFEDFIEQKYKGYTKKDLAKITEIECRNKKLSDLDGIEYFTSLKVLDCSFNMISKVDGKAIPNIETFICHKNIISDFSFLKDMKNLKNLQCMIGNRINYYQLYQAVKDLSYITIDKLWLRSKIFNDKMNVLENKFKRKMTDIEKAYKEIFNIMSKHADKCIFDIKDLKEKADIHLFGLKLKNLGYNIKPENIQSIDWCKFNEFLYIGWYDKNNGRTISWSDDKKQPSVEHLLIIKFPTGAYIFGDDYPTKLFNEFFNELKLYKPKYSDTNNKSLYFSLEGGAKIFNSFNDIIVKYRHLNEEDKKMRRIEKLRKELENLENS